MYTHPDIADDSEMRPNPTGFKGDTNTKHPYKHRIYALSLPHKFAPILYIYSLILGSRERSLCYVWAQRFHQLAMLGRHIARSMCQTRRLA